MGSAITLGTTTTQPRRLLPPIDDRITLVYYLLLQPMHNRHMPTRTEAALPDTHQQGIGQISPGSRVQPSTLVMSSSTAYVDL